MLAYLNKDTLAIRLIPRMVQASHKNAEKQLQRTSQNLIDSIAAVDTLGEQLQAAGERYAFLQQIRAYIADLCDMLQVRCSPWQHGPNAWHASVACSRCNADLCDMLQVRCSPRQHGPNALHASVACSRCNADLCHKLQLYV